MNILTLQNITSIIDSIYDYDQYDCNAAPQELKNSNHLIYLIY